MKIKRLVAALLSVLLCVTMLSDMMAVFAEELLPEAAFSVEETEPAKETEPEVKTHPEEAPEEAPAEEDPLPEEPAAEPEPAPAEEETPEEPEEEPAPEEKPAAEETREVGPFDPTDYDHDLDDEILYLSVEPQTYLEGDTTTVTTTIEGENGEITELVYDNYYLCERPWLHVEALNNATYEGYPEDVQQQMLADYGLSGDLHLTDYFVNQHYHDYWDVGMHEGYLYFAGETYTYQIEVIENPVQSLTVEDVYRTPAMSFVQEVHDEEGHVIGQYDWYEIDPRITVWTPDGALTGKATTVDGWLQDTYHLTRRTPTQLSSDQSAQNPWYTGDHDASFNLWGGQYPYTVHVVDSLLASIEIPVQTYVLETLETVEVTETVDGEEVTWDRLEVNCVPDGIEIETIDGYTATGPAEAIRWEIINHFDLSDQIVTWTVTTDQSYDNPWGIGGHWAYLNLLGESYVYGVNIMGSPIETVQVHDLSFTTADAVEVESQFYNEETGEMEIRTFPRYPLDQLRVTVETSLGTFTGTIDEITNWIVSYYGLSCAEPLLWIEDPQTYDNQWGVGTHTAVLKTFNASFEFSVVIEKSPIASVIVLEEPVFFLGVGDVRETWIRDEETDKDILVAYPYYNVNNIPKIYVEMTDGNTFEAQPWDVGWELFRVYGLNPDGKIQVETALEQPYDAQWGVGDYDATLSFYGVEAPFKAHVVENPVVSVSVQTLQLTEMSANTVTDPVYDPETGEYNEVDWQHYHLGNATVTVVMADGTEYNGTFDEVSQSIRQQYGLTSAQFLILNDPQSVDNQWTPGTYTVDLTFFGVQTQMTVEITGSPIESVAVTGPTYILGMGDPCSSYTYDDYGNEILLGEWMSYEPDPILVAVTLTDGEILTGDLVDVRDAFCEKYGLEPTWESCRVEDDQGYDNEWGVGEHACVLHFFGKTCDYVVTIIDNPILSLTADPILLIEGMMTQCAKYDSQANQWIVYYNYLPVPDEITIETTKGTFSGNTGLVAEQFREAYGLQDSGNNCEIVTDQDMTYCWEPGAHEASLYLYGVLAGTFGVTILPTPVTEVSAEPLSYLEGACGQDLYEWQDDEGNWHYDYYDYYDINPDRITAVAGGKTYTGYPGSVIYQICEDYGVKYNGYGIYFTSDQSYSNVWGAGTHTATMTFLGKTCEYEVTIIANPILSVEPDPIRLMEGDTLTGREQYYDEATGEYVSEDYQFYSVEHGRGKVRVVTSDKTYYDSFYLVYNQILSDYGLESGSYHYSSEQDLQHQWGVGDHEATLTFMGVSGTYTVTVIPDPVLSVTAADTTVLEGATSLMGSYGPDGEYYEYYAYRPGTALTVTTELGSVTGDRRVVEDWFAEQYGIDHITNCRIVTDQAYDNLWTAEGSPYEATYLFGAHAATFLVTIEGSPVQAMTLSGAKFFEGDTYPGFGYPFYPVSDALYNVQLHLETKDRVYDGLFYEVINQFVSDYGLEDDYYQNLSIQTDQSSQNVWGVGVHYATVVLYGCAAQWEVEIIPNPIVSVMAEPVTRTSGTMTRCWYYVDTWNSEQQYIDCYDLTPNSIHVVAGSKDYEGSVDQIRTKLLEDYGAMPSEYYMSDQSATNVWGVGEHTAVLRFGGVETEYPVTIKENPILSVSVDDFAIFVGDGYETEWYNPETEQFEDGLYFDAVPAVFEVETTKGTFRGDRQQFFDYMQENYGMTVGIVTGSSQFYGNPWTVGNTYDASMTLSGVTAEYRVSIIPDEITALTVEDLTFMEGDTVTDIWYTQEGPVQFQRYDVYPRNVSVTIRGKEYTGRPEDIRRDVFEDIHVSMSVSYGDDQSPDNVWGPGVHQAGIYLGGYPAVYNVTIVAQEAATITVKAASGSEGITVSWNKVTGATKYTIYSVKGSKATKLGTTTDLNYLVTKDGKNELQMGTTYKYKVTATIPGASAVSDTASVKFNPFKDVPNNSPSFDYIAWAYNKEIVKGSVEPDGNRYFYPNGSTSRMNFVMILWKMHGSPVVKGKNPFKDVTGTKSVNAVKWAVKQELVKGTDATHFSPDMNLSRMNIIMILYKLAGSPKASGTNPFVDVSGSKSVKAVLWALQKGIITGVDDTHFDPDGNCSRALFVEVLYKYNQIYKILK